MKKRYLIIGASAAGVSAAAKIRQLDADAEIVCFSAEKEAPYNKCFLADYLSGSKTQAQTDLRSESFFSDNAIELKLATLIKKIDPQKKVVVCHEDKEYSYTKLLIAAGGSVQLPPIDGIDLPHVFSFYTLADTQAILNYVRQHNVQKAVVIGAGLSGLECADSLCKYIESITVLDREYQVLPRQITKEGAAFIQKYIEASGVVFMPGVVVKKISTNKVILESGHTLEADLVVCAIGAQPNGQLGKDAGLSVDHGALKTDDFLRTSDEHIFAAGDCAQVKDTLTGNLVKNCTWPDAMMQGMIAGTNMVEPLRQYQGVTIITSSAFFGVKFFSGGVVQEGTSHNSVLRQHAQGHRHIFHHNGVIKGFILVGQTHGVADLKRSLLTKTVSAVLE